MKKIFFLAALLLSMSLAFAQNLVDFPQVEFVFASQSEASGLLSTEDDFTVSLSPFDRQSRVKSDAPVDQQQYLDFIGQQGMEWTREEESNVRDALNQISSSLYPKYNVKFPQKIILVKTTGLEEGNSAYCRGNNVICVCEQMLDVSVQELYDLYLHELFHIFSRNNLELQEELYGQLGFVKARELEITGSLLNGKITNPDAVKNNYYFTASIFGAEFKFMPLLVASRAYSSRLGWEFFNYMRLVFVIVEEDQNGIHAVKSRGDFVMAYLQDIPEYLDKVGRNTDYIIHPEEILADNFVFMVKETKGLPSPEIVSNMEKLLLNPQK